MQFLASPTADASDETQDAQNRLNLIFADDITSALMLDAEMPQTSRQKGARAGCYH